MTWDFCAGDFNTILISFPFLIWTLAICGYSIQILVVVILSLSPNIMCLVNFSSVDNQTPPSFQSCSFHFLWFMFMITASIYLRLIDFSLNSRCYQMPAIYIILTFLLQLIFIMFISKPLLPYESAAHLILTSASK